MTDYLSVYNAVKAISNDVSLVAVSKFHPYEAVMEAYDAGARIFGENRVQEMREKFPPKNERPEGMKVYLIGQLQRNKVRKAMEHFDVIHSVDTLKLASKISEVAVEFGKEQSILLQLNNAGEVQKSGFSKTELFDSFGQIKDLKNLKILGLMNMAPLGASEDVLRTLFAEVRNVRDELNRVFGCSMSELSMGMSQERTEEIRWQQLQTKSDRL